MKPMFILNLNPLKKTKKRLEPLFLKYMEYLTIGYINKTHGIDGGLSLISTSSFIDERMKVGNIVYIYIDKNYVPFKISTSSVSNHVYFKLEGINTIDEAKKLVGYDLECEKKELEEGLYYYEDLKGLIVKDIDGKIIGSVIDIYDQSYQINLKIKKNDGKTFYLPFVDAIVIEIKLEEKCMYIINMGGM